jgi:hypothetical protein
MNTDIPGFSANHAINKIRINGREYFLDATSSSHRFPFFRGDDKGVHCINILEKKFEYIPLSRPEENMNSAEFTINIGSGGSVNISKTIRLTGDFESDYRRYWEKIPEDMRSKILVNAVNAAGSNPEITDFEFENLYDISKPFKMKYSYKADKSLIKAGDFLILDLPSSEIKFDFLKLEKRNHDLYISDNYCYSNSYTISFPFLLEIRHMPARADINNKYYRCTAFFELKNPQLLKFTSFYYQKTNYVPAADYPGMRSDLKSFERFFKNKIFFTEKK